jgi:hypothetical protein
MLTANNCVASRIIGEDRHGNLPEIRLTMNAADPPGCTKNWNITDTQCYCEAK